MGLVFFGKTCNLAKLDFIQLQSLSIIGITIPQVAWFNDDKTPNKEGSHSQKLALIEGLTSNIHYSDKNGYIDSASNLRDIIARLEEGFARAGATTKPEKWNR